MKPIPEIMATQYAHAIGRIHVPGGMKYNWMLKRKLAPFAPTASQSGRKDGFFSGLPMIGGCSMRSVA